MGNTFYFDWEIKLMEGLQAHMSPALEKLASAVTFMGTENALVLLLGFLLWCYDKERGRRFGVCMMLGLVWFAYIKNIFIRRRPYFDNPSIKCLTPVDKNADIYSIKDQGFSFPSGHTTNSTIGYGSLTFYYKNKIVRVLGVVLPLLIGISRFAVGVHYPTDVIAGWALGLLFIFGTDYMFNHVKRLGTAYLIIFLISATGCFFADTTDYYTGIGMMGGFFLADLYEEKYVKSENASNVREYVLRLACGCALFAALNAGLKLPFSKEFLESATPLCFMVRAIRYGVTVFIICGLYPKLFPYFKKKTTKANA